MQCKVGTSIAIYDIALQAQYTHSIQLIWWEVESLHQPVKELNISCLNSSNESTELFLARENVS